MRAFAQASLEEEHKNDGDIPVTIDSKQSTSADSSNTTISSFDKKNVIRKGMKSIKTELLEFDDDDDDESSLEASMRATIDSQSQQSTSLSTTHSGGTVSRPSSARSNKVIIVPTFSR